MLRTLSSYLLLGLFLLQFSTKLFIEIDFLINQTDIIENLCENKDKPELKCNGKCYLMKQMQENERLFENQSDESDNKTQNYLKSMEYVEVDPSENVSPIFVSTSDRNFSRGLSSLADGFINLVFHPPLT